MSTKPTRVDSIWAKFKNNKAIAITIVGATILISVGSFIDAVKKIDNLFNPSTSEAGGLIEHPTTPAHYYHNARIYELNGDLKNAKASYSAYFQSNQDFIDPHYFFQDALKNSDGLQEARRYYQSLREKFPANIMYEFLQARLLDAGERAAAYEAVLKRQPDYLPALYELTRERAHITQGDSTLEEKELEFRALEDFVTREKSSGFLRYYIDKRIGQQALDEVQSRYELVKQWDLPAITDVISVTSEVYGDGLVALVFSPSELATEIWYKLPGMRDYLSTGSSTISLDSLSPGDLSGRRLANYGAKVGKLPPGRHLVTLKYKDRKDHIRGPYEKEFTVPVQAIQDVENYLANWWLDPRAKQFRYLARANDKEINLTFDWFQFAEDARRFTRVTYSFDNGKSERVWVKDGRRIIDAEDEYPKLKVGNLNERDEYSLLVRIEFVNGKRFTIQYKFHIIKDDVYHAIEGIAVPSG